MFILYDLVFIIFALLYLPIFILRRKFHRGFKMRLGAVPAAAIAGLKDKLPIWIHAVSVGEVVAVEELVNLLTGESPQDPIVISTVTPTGNRLACDMFKDKNVLVIYLPLDISFIVRRVIGLIRPKIFINVETEIWPNLIYFLHRYNVPIIFVNSRISDSSFKGYKLIKSFLKKILKKIDLFCVQNITYSQRLIYLGANPQKIKITGSMKFDVAFRKLAQVQSGGFKKVLSLREDDLVLIAGSTHRGEEKIVLNAYRDLIPEFPNLKLIIAPRHIERIKDIETLINKYGFQASRVSRIDSYPTSIQEILQIFILDTIGQLQNLYRLGTVIFVGGSLVNIGGHNILEPAIFAKPIIFGSSMFNFKDIADTFLNNQAAIRIKDAFQLKQNIKTLLQDSKLREDLGKRAEATVKENIGATGEVFLAIKPLLLA